MVRYGLPSRSVIRLYQPIPVAELASMRVGGWWMNAKEMEKEECLDSLDFAGEQKCA
jgi:hypothetical protein